MKKQHHMKPVEQAIFTLVGMDREAGYQVVASSPGVCAADAKELAIWEPSCDSLLDMSPEAESFNFHPLPSGAYCISRTTPAGWQSGGSQRVYTHCLLVPPEVLARFANNPFALIREMSEHELWQNPGVPCPRLEAISLPGGAPPVDQALLHQLAGDTGPEKMAVLVQVAREALCLAIASARQPASLIAGLFSCLPIECRPEFSFSTGLKFSPRRPFRIVTLSEDIAEQLWVANYANVTVLDLDGDATLPTVSLDSWSHFVERALSTGHIAFLGAQISKRRFDLSLDDLPALGMQLLESLDSLEFCGDDEIPAPSEKRMAIDDQRAHAAHRQFEKSMAATATMRAAPPHLGLFSPEILEKLEHLDDLVYEAISGQSGSMEQLRTAWPKLLDELGGDMLGESREQYLRYAMSIWEECAQDGEIRNPARAIQALDVLCLLFGD
jgi:hypothetical protein